MKKTIILCLICIVLTTSVLISCNTNNFKPIALKFQNFDYVAYVDGEHKRFLVDLLNSKWDNDVAKCECDYTILMKNDRKIFYHSDSGTFIDYDFDKSLRVKEEDRVKLNYYFAEIMCRSNVHYFDDNFRCTFCGFVTPKHEHTGYFYMNEEIHFYEYTCGCETKDISELHIDGDKNYICDICNYVMFGREKQS